MKMISFIDWTGFILAKILTFFAFFIPLKLALFLGRLLGMAAFLVDGKRRKMAYANLKAAFCKDLSPAQIRKVAKSSFQTLGLNLVEVLKFPYINKKYIDKYIRIENLTRVDKALAKNKGVILLTAHFGNWELSALAAAIRGYPMLVLAREQRHPRLNRLLNSYREKKGCRVIQKGMGLREIIRSLKRNELVGMLGDQSAGRSGDWIDFFGRPASTPRGPVDIALRTGSEILPSFIIREKGGSHRLVIEAPLELNRDGGNKDDKVISSLKRFNELLESYVRKYPAQWLWPHNRWKRTPLHLCLVLGDRASTGGEELYILECMRERVRTETIEVRFKNSFTRWLLTLFSPFASFRCQGCMRCVKFCLEKKSYAKLMKTYASIIVPSNPGLKAVSRFLAKENNAQEITRIFVRG